MTDIVTAFAEQRKDSLTGSRGHKARYHTAPSLAQDFEDMAKTTCTRVGEIFFFFFFMVIIDAGIMARERVTSHIVGSLYTYTLGEASLSFPTYQPAYTC